MLSGALSLVAATLIFGALLLRPVLKFVFGLVVCVVCGIVEVIHLVFGNKAESHATDSRSSWLQKVTNVELEEQLMEGIAAKDFNILLELKQTWSRYFDCSYPAWKELNPGSDVDFGQPILIGCQHRSNEPGEMFSPTALRILMANRGFLMYNDAVYGIGMGRLSRTYDDPRHVYQQQLRAIMAIDNVLRERGIHYKMYVRSKMYITAHSQVDQYTALDRCDVWDGDVVWAPMVSSYDLKQSAKREVESYSKVPGKQDKISWRLSVSDLEIEHSVLMRLRDKDEGILEELRESWPKYCDNEFTKRSPRDAERAMRILMANRGLLTYMDAWQGIRIHGDIGSTEAERRENYASQERFILAINGALNGRGICQDLYIELFSGGKYKRFPVRHSYTYHVGDFGGTVLWSPMREKSKMLSTEV